MAGKLSTHVLDLTTGRPAAGMRVELCDGDGMVVRAVVTNGDGRTDRPMLEGATMRAGVFELRFFVGEFFGDAEAGFLDVVPVRFRISNAEVGYHVPLLCTPWAYSTYRGS